MARARSRLTQMVMASESSAFVSVIEAAVTANEGTTFGFSAFYGR